MRPLVLHVAPCLWSGAGSVITRLCEAQRAKGPVAIVTTGQSGRFRDWPAYRQRLRRAGVTHYALDFLHRREDRFWSAASQLSELMRDLQPAVIHAHAGVPACGAVVARAMGGHRARVIGQMYSWGPHRPDWMNRQDAWGLGQADRIVCSARAYGNLLVSYGVPLAKMVYLPWGLPLERLPFRTDLRSDRPHRVSRTGPIIGFVGRIEPRKRQLELVEAFARVRAVHAEARLELVGPIADHAYATCVRAAVNAHRLKGAVTITRHVPDVTRYVRRWDLFVSLSADEGQGLAVLEAMAIGAPVVAQPVAGIADFLEHNRTGFAIAGMSNRSASDAILQALADPVRMQEVARGARRLVERAYAFDRTVTAFEKLYWAPMTGPADPR